MKKLFLALLAAGTVSAANAQMANSWLIYGDANYHQTTSSYGSGSPDFKTITWSATPGIGYQFNKNWTVGINLHFGQNASDSYDSTGTTSGTVRVTHDDYAIGPFVRYVNYIGDSKTFFWFGQVNLNYLGGYTTSGDQPASEKYNGLQVFAYPSLGVNLGRAWCLNFSIGGIGYHNEKSSDDNSVHVHYFDFNFGQEMTFGVSKNIGGHHMHGHHEPGDDMHHMDTSDDSNDSGSSDDNGGKHRRHRHHGDNDNKDKNNDE